ncbi:MAG: hypothetical protein HYZ52_03720, partial [Candidatus Omnitrophica bacterium]|nr:hypothetical protein [Candidatus Omnitrophota bacterium]
MEDLTEIKSRWSLRVKFISAILVVSFAFEQVSFAAERPAFLREREKEKKDSAFLPRYLIEQQKKAEELTQRKNDLAAINESLNGNELLGNKVREQAAEMRRKLFEPDKRRPGGGGGEEAAAFTMEDTDGNGEFTDPNDQLNLYQYDSNGKLTRVASIRAGDVGNISSYVSASHAEDTKDGDKIRVGGQAIDSIQYYLEKDLVESLTYYDADGNPSYSLSAFDNGMASQISVYGREGGVLKTVKTYAMDTAGLNPSDSKDSIFGRLSDDLLVSLQEYEGEKGKERLKDIFFDYAKENGVNTPHSFESFDYDSNGDRKSSFTYDISDTYGKADWDKVKQAMMSHDAAYDNDKTSEKIYSGSKKANRLDQELHLANGEILSRDEYLYDSKNKLLSMTSFDTEGLAAAEARKKGTGEEKNKSYYDERQRTFRATDANGQSISDFGDRPRDPREAAGDSGATVVYVTGHQGDPDWIQTITYADGSNYAFTYGANGKLDKVYFALKGPAGNENKITTYSYTLIDGKAELSLIGQMNHHSTAYEYRLNKLVRTYSFKDEDSDGRAGNTERVLSVAYYNSFRQVVNSFSFKSGTTFDKIAGDSLGSALTNQNNSRSNVYTYYGTLLRARTVTSYRGQVGDNQVLSSTFYNNDAQNTIYKTVQYSGGDMNRVKGVAVYNYSNGGIIGSVAEVRGDISDAQITALKGDDGKISEAELLTYASAKSFAFYQGNRGREKISSIKSVVRDGGFKEVKKFLYRNDQDAGLDEIKTEDATGLLKNELFYLGYAGQEQLNFIQSYNTDGKTVRGTQIAYYEGNSRAKNAGFDSAQIRIESFRGGTSGSDDTTNLKLQSKTFFDIRLGKGDEIADTSVSFNSDNSQTKSFSKNYYNVNGIPTSADKLTAANT